MGSEFVVFNICKDNYRLVVRVDYERRKVFIYGVYTHRDYDDLDLSAIDKELTREPERKRVEREDR